jgi:hypothetical protein
MGRKTFEGYLELDGVELTSAIEFTATGGREKTKQFPISRDALAKGTVYGNKTFNGTLVVTGYDTDGYEFDWDAMTSGKSEHTFVHVLDSVNRRQYVEVEFSTADDGIPADKGEYRLTLNWVATDRAWI